MKKTLAAIAVLGAFAGSSFAANVTLYGALDTGFGFTSTDNGVKGEDAVNKFDLRSGMNGANKFGFKGEEDLGNGVKVGFSLENGFEIDDGTINNGGRLFGREALIYANGAFGEVAAGRMGELASGNGRYGLFGGKVSPISTGWSDIAGHKYVMANGFARLDNTVTYKTPTFAGVNVLAQYSFAKDNKSITKEREGSSQVDRQYALGATYTVGDLYVAGIVTQTNLASATLAGVVTDKDDPLSVSLGANYDFGVAKVFVATQYFKDSQLCKVIQTKLGGDKLAYDGFGLSVGANVPVLGGTAKALVAYMDAEEQNVATGAKDHDMQRYVFSVGYEYPLSKRTTVYAGAGYYQDNYDFKLAGYDDKASVTAVNLGIMHSF